jgi:hypothetical protein
LVAEEDKEDLCKRMGDEMECGTKKSDEWCQRSFKGEDRRDGAVRGATRKGRCGAPGSTQGGLLGVCDKGAVWDLAR